MISKQSPVDKVIMNCIITFGEFIPPKALIFSLEYVFFISFNVYSPELAKTF